RERETKNKKVATVLVETSTLVKAPNPAVCRMANNAHWFSKKPDTATIKNRISARHGDFG
ncbi:MAG: hypothetical protein AAF636_27760, partial [Pseudomonadota bacterium]